MKAVAANVGASQPIHAVESTNSSQATDSSSGIDSLFTTELDLASSSLANNRRSSTNLAPKILSDEELLKLKASLEAENGQLNDLNAPNLGLMNDLTLLAASQMGIIQAANEANASGAGSQGELGVVGALGAPGTTGTPGTPGTPGTLPGGLTELASTNPNAIALTGLLDPTSAGTLKQNLLNALNASQLNAKALGSSLATNSGSNANLTQADLTPAQLAALQEKQLQLANAAIHPDDSARALGKDAKILTGDAAGLINSKLSPAELLANQERLSAMSTLKKGLTPDASGVLPNSNPLTNLANGAVLVTSAQLLQNIPSEAIKLVSVKAGTTENDRDGATHVNLIRSWDAFAKEGSRDSGITASNLADGMVGTMGTMGTMPQATSMKDALQAAIDASASSLKSADAKLAKITTEGTPILFMNPLAGNGTLNETQVKVDVANVSLAKGPLNNEVLNAAKAGGGRIILEVTPPDSGPIRIDLQIDKLGQAHLVIHGASDASQARLEQGEGQLKQQFAQMGLNLSLDMRQNSANSEFSGQMGGQSNPSNKNSLNANTFDEKSNKMNEVMINRSTRSNLGNDLSSVNLVA